MQIGARPFTSAGRIATLAIALALAGCRSAPLEDVPPPLSDGTPRVVVDPTMSYQTMSGWETTAQAGQDLSPAYPAFRDQMLDHAVNELGLDRLRIEILSGIENTRDTYAEVVAGTISDDEWRPLRYATVNDNDDPFVVNKAAFHFTQLDNQIEKVALPMKSRLEARGERLFINICYVAFTGQIRGGKYDHADPEEYAEFVQATFEHLAERYGVVPDAWEMHLEPDNTREWTKAYMRRAMIATGNRLLGMGRTPKLIAPSTTNMAHARDYADEIARGGLPRLWSTLSYHRYSGVSEGMLRAIAQRASQWNLDTAMLEHMGSGADDLHQDLKVGNNSSWQRFILTFPGPDDGGKYYLVDATNPASPRVSLSPQTFQLQQYFQHIRAGAVRVGATTSDDAFDPVAFINKNGKYVVVVKAARSGTFAVEGLAPGAYELTYATVTAASLRGGTVTVSAGQAAKVTMPVTGVLTISAM